MSIDKAVQVWRTEKLIDYVLRDLGRRVKRDKSTKLSVFFTGLSAYLPDPVNLFLKGPSGVGKTYNVVETLRYFPQGSGGDVWFLGGLSPKALIHDYGQLLNKDGEPLDLTEKPVKPKKRHYKEEAEYREAYELYKEEMKAWVDEIRNSYTLIDLTHKILVFLESPEYKTFKMLFPILSHDTKRIEYRFTDKTSRGQLRTSRVVIQGWPATIFLSTDRKYMEELSTRSFTATPEASQEKIIDANVLTNMKASFPWQYNHETEETETIKKLVSSIKNQFSNGVDVVVPFPNLHELFPKEIIRDMRDFAHFIQLMKTVTALNLCQRPFMKKDDRKFIISTVEDVRKTLEIYCEVFETTRTGTEQRILTFYHEIVKTKDTWYLKELTAKYNDGHNRKASSETLRRMLLRLSEIGYVDVRKDDEDKRLNIYEPLVKEEEMSIIKHNLEMWTLSKAELAKGFKTWRKNILHKTPFYYYENLGENTWGEHEIGDIFSFIFGEGLCRIVSNEDLRLKTEKKPESIHIPEMCGVVDNSNGEQVSGEGETCPKPSEKNITLEKRVPPVKAEVLPKSLRVPPGADEYMKHVTLGKENMIQCCICEKVKKCFYTNNVDDMVLHVQRIHRKLSFSTEPGKAVVV